MYNILLIDDEDQIRKVISLYLAKHDFAVDTAENGKVGVKKLTEKQYDVLVTDLIMPEQEGIETIIQVKEKHPDLKIIAISGGGKKGNLDFLDSAKILGADEILKKPFVPSQLLQIINELLD